MSFVTTQPEMLSTAAGELASAGSIGGVVRQIDTV